MKQLGNMLRQAQQMQQKMAKMQEELAQKEIEASSGGGMVVCRVNGKQEILLLKISREVVDPNDVEMLEDLVRAAVSEAIKKSQELVSAEMNKITGGMGLNLPKMF